MNSNIDVSVILLTYKPNMNKVKRTLSSIIMQKGLTFEMIVSDDGSTQDYRDEIEAFLQTYHFDRYYYNKNVENIGTVKNYYSGMMHAKGKYVFAISPGDMLLEENSLRDMFDFCERGKLNICFGNAIYYKYVNERATVYSGANCPTKPYMYGVNAPFSKMKADFFWEENILGVTYIRERKCALKCFEAILDKAIYLEDKCSTAVALAWNIPIVHFDKNIVWYEDGTGVSTSGSNEWAKKLKKDYYTVISDLKKRFKKDRLLDLAYIRITHKNKFVRLLTILVKHPILFVERIFTKIKNVKCTDSSESLQKQLDSIMQNGGE